jgi:hypothetical protein
MQEKVRRCLDSWLTRLRTFCVNRECTITNVGGWVILRALARMGRFAGECLWSSLNSQNATHLGAQTSTCSQFFKTFAL